MTFKSVYSSTSDDLKLKFLDAIISQNPELQNQFSKYVEAKEGLHEHFSLEIFCQEAKDTKAMYLSFFGEIDTEKPDFDNYHPSHNGYIPDYEEFQEASEQEVGEIFGHFKLKAMETIISHQPDKLLAMLIGLLEAANEADIEDPVATFDDYNYFLKDEFYSTIKSIVEKVKLAPFGESIILSAWSLFFSYCDKGYFKDAVSVRYFEELLIILAEKCNSGEGLLTIFDQSSTKREELPQLTLLLMKKCGNPEEWLKAALQTYFQDKEVARQLLEHYHKNDLVSFKKVSRELFTRDKRHWAKFLKDFITPEIEKSLYVDVFCQLTVDETDINHYNTIRGFLSETEKNELIKELSWQEAFVAQILKIEERYEEIKKLAESTYSERNFPHIIEPILSAYPEFCFNELSSRVWKTLESQRGRHVYQTISNWLKLSQSIPGFSNEKKELISRLYHHKPNLPALRDELRKAGLVN